MTVEEQLFSHHSGKSILLDSNLLLVFIGGTLGAAAFARFKRISAYTIRDYELLVRFLRSFTILITTPHVLTEVSNLANSLPDWWKPDWFENLASLIASEKRSPGLRERWIPATELSQMPEFAAFGITDSALTRLASEALVLTDDRRLSGFLKVQGTTVLNFHDLRNLQQLL